MFAEIMELGLNWPKPWGLVLYIGLNMESINKCQGFNAFVVSNKKLPL